MNVGRYLAFVALRLVGWTIMIVGDLGTGVAAAGAFVASAAYDAAAAVGHAAFRIRGPP